jgi:release factor glutamine methyltransferase
MQIRQTVSSIAVKLIQIFGPRRVIVSGKTYIISRHVFNPRFYITSEFMAGHISVKPQDKVLDIGTGAGIQAVTAGQTAEKVIAVDISPEAVRYAGENIRLNNLSHVVTVIQGDLFSPLNPGSKFDVILFTPPYLEGRLKTVLDHALYDPDKKLSERFFREAGKYLKPDGYIQMVYSSLAEPERVLKIADNYGWRYRAVAEKSLRFETIFIYRFTLRNV